MHISVDASNHIDMKMVPIIVRYCTLPDLSIRTQILEFSNLPGESADILCQQVMKTVENHGIIIKSLEYLLIIQIQTLVARNDLGKITCTLN